MTETAKTVDVLLTVAGWCVLCTLPTLMIVGGVLSDTVVCESPCKNYGCTPKDVPYNLPTPRVGISTGVWLIVNGVCLIVNITTFFFKKMVYIVLPYGFMFSWLVVGTIVYTQTKKLCDDHDNGLWTIETTNVQWLLASVVGGFILFVFIPCYLSFCSVFCGKKEERASWGIDV
jgi:hypothetical protein